MKFKHLQITYQQSLEDEINEFIKDKNITNIKVEKTGYSQMISYEVFIAYS